MDYVGKSIQEVGNSWIRYGYYPAHARYNGQDVLLLGIFQEENKPVAVIKHANGSIESVSLHMVTITED